MVVVFDDVTPLVRAQKVAAWREVARRLAHEIKNPLTPIQLCAERLRRHFTQAPRADASARRRVHDDDRRRGRVAQGAGRRVLAVCAHAGAARRADRSARAARRCAVALSGAASPRSRSGRTSPRRCRGCRRSGADSPRDHQPRGQRDRGDGPPRRDRHRDRSTTRRTIWFASSSPTTAPASRRPNARSCFCRITRPSSGAAASASPSSAASSPSTAAAST